jgi:hypothetical protein
MRMQFDQLAKSILDKLLRPVGTVHPQHEVRSTVQAVDIWFEPQPGHAAERARLGPLGRISEEACMLEPFHEAPGLREVRACIRKQYNLAHWQEHEARSTPDEPPFPRLWILSAGRPESVLSGYEMRSMERGSHTTAPASRPWASCSGRSMPCVTGVHPERQGLGDS